MMKQRIGSMVAGAGVALWPLIAQAAEGEHSAAASRALGAPSDLNTIVLITLLALIGVFVLAGLGFLYRRERGLEWAFQRPDPPRDEHH